MDSVKAIAESNLKLSEALSDIRKIKEEKVKFIIDRENEAMIAVQSVLQDSKEMLIEATSNHTDIQLFLGEVTALHEQVKQTSDELDSVLKLFVERNLAVEADVKLIIDDVSLKRNNIDIDKKRIENDMEAIKKKNIQVSEEMRNIMSIKGALEREINRLKK